MQMDPSRLEQNPYLYSYNNPTNYTDPSGQKACWPSDKPEVCQTYPPTSMPYVEGSTVYNPNGFYTTDYIDFDPAMGLKPIPGLSHQYDIIEHYAEQNGLDPAEVLEELGLNSLNCDFKSCGPLSVATILYNLLGGSMVVP
jgi:hypothetical protein